MLSGGGCKEPAGQKTSGRACTAWERAGPPGCPAVRQKWLKLPNRGPGLAAAVLPTAVTRGLSSRHGPFPRSAGASTGFRGDGIEPSRQNACSRAAPSLGQPCVLELSVVVNAFSVLSRSVAAEHLRRGWWDSEAELNLHRHVWLLSAVSGGAAPETDKRESRMSEGDEDHAEGQGRRLGVPAAWAACVPRITCAREWPVCSFH